MPVHSVDLPTVASGVYVIAVDVDPANVALRPEADEPEHARWVPDQAVVYVGRATSLRRRLKKFRRHRYGDNAPHRGGQAILLLDCPKSITWAEAIDFDVMEDRLLKAFMKRGGRMPYGNRVRSAQPRTDTSGSAATAADVNPVSAMRTVSHLTPEQEADNCLHDEIVERATCGLHD